MKSTRFGLIIAILGLFILVIFSSSVVALEIPPRPTTIPIVDQTGTLTEEQKTILAQLIASERQKSGNQIAIVIVPSLEDEPLENFSLSIAREWGIGTKNDNGVLLLISKNDKKLRIEVGYGLEGALTDIQSGKIIKNEITPAFKQGLYYDGVHAGLTSIIAAIHNEYTASATDNKSDSSLPWDFIFYLAIFGFSWLGSIIARTKSWWLGGVVGGMLGCVIWFFAESMLFGIVCVVLLTVIGLVLDKAVSANYRTNIKAGRKPSWWAGGGMFSGGGSSSGGSGGGFGGGSFGGGGASGGW